LDYGVVGILSIYWTSLFSDQASADGSK